MRNPLQRRMFMNPQQRRGMARMPQGILASGPRIMNAAMQSLGGVVPTGDMPGAEDIPSFLPGDVNFGAVDPAPGVSVINTGGLRGDRARGYGRNIDDSVVEIPNNVVPPSNTDAEGRRRRAPKVEPNNEPEEKPKITVLGPEDKAPQGGGTAQGGGITPPDKDPSYFGDLGGNQQEERADPYKQIFDMLNAQMPEGKSTETYIDEATELLKKYGIREEQGGCNTASDQPQEDRGCWRCYQGTLVLGRQVQAGRLPRSRWQNVTRRRHRSGVRRQRPQVSLRIRVCWSNCRKSFSLLGDTDRRKQHRSG